MNLSISNIAWNANEDSNIYELMRKYGFKGVEIAPTRFFSENPYDTNISDIKTVKSNIDKENLQIVAMQSILFGHPEFKLFGNDGQREELYDYLENAIKFASILESKILVFGSPKNRIYEDKSRDYDIAVSFFREIGCCALKNNVKLCIEPNPKEYNTNFINTTSEGYELVRKVNNEGFGLHVDTGTIFINNEDFSILEKVAEYISHLHLSEPFLDLIRKENVEKYNKISNILKKIGYNKWVSIEMKKTSDYNNYSNIENALECISTVFGR